MTLDNIFRSYCLFFCTLLDFRHLPSVNIRAFSSRVTIVNTQICQNVTSFNQVKAQFEAQIKIYVCRFFEFNISLTLYSTVVWKYYHCIQH